MSIIAIDKVYQKTGIIELQKRLLLETAFATDYTKINNLNHGKTAIFPVRTPPAADTTAVNPAVGSTTTAVATETEVPVSMLLYGDTSRTVTGEDGLYGLNATEPQKAYVDAIQDAAIQVAKTRHELAKDALVKTVPDTNAAYPHPLGPYNPISDELIFNGNVAATSKTARNLITAGETFNDPEFLDKVYEVAINHGWEPWQLDLNGEPIFNWYVPAKVWKLFKNVTAAAADLQAFQIQGTSTGLISNVVRVLRGFRLIVVPDSDMLWPGAGAAGIDIYSNVFCGQGYVGRAALPVADLPGGDPAFGTDSYKSYPIDESTDIRIKPSGDAQGIINYVTPMYYGGTGVIQPPGGLRWDVAGV